MRAEVSSTSSIPGRPPDLVRQISRVGTPPPREEDHQGAWAREEQQVWPTLFCNLHLVLMETADDDSTTRPHNGLHCGDIKHVGSAGWPDGSRNRRT